MLSARNQLAAVVKSVKLGNVMAEVVVEVAGTEIVAIITRGSAEALKLYSQGIMSRRSSSQQRSSSTSPESPARDHRLFLAVTPSRSGPGAGRARQSSLISTP